MKFTVIEKHRNLWTGLGKIWAGVGMVAVSGIAAAAYRFGISPIFTKFAEITSGRNSTHYKVISFLTRYIAPMEIILKYAYNVGALGVFAHGIWNLVEFKTDFSISETLPMPPMHGNVDVRPSQLSLKQYSYGDPLLAVVTERPNYFKWMKDCYHHDRRLPRQDKYVISRELMNDQIGNDTAKYDSELVELKRRITNIAGTNMNINLSRYVPTTNLNHNGEDIPLGLVGEKTSYLSLNYIHYLRQKAPLQGFQTAHDQKIRSV